MVKTSGSIRAAPLRTYSRRVNITTEKPPGKRKLSEDHQAAVELPPSKTLARSSIQSYFQPLSSSSSPASVQSLQSSDDLNLRSTPPSSPPSEASNSSILTRRPQKRPKRRISTKVRVSVTAKMPSTFDRCVEDCVCPNRGSGDARSSPIPCRPSPYTLTVAGQRLLTQTQLSLGNAPTFVTCELCKQTYNPTDHSDRKVHADRHAETVTLDSENVDFGSVTIDDQVVNKDRILYIKVNRRSAAPIRSFAARVVEKVDAELGYDKLDNIWAPGKDFRVFIVLLNSQPVGALVAETISKAGRYSCEFELDESNHMKEELSEEIVSTEIDMCVDRLWVDPKHRGGATQGIRFAVQLMDLARGHFYPNYQIPKYKVAFSHPTYTGYVFACKYFGDAFESVPKLKERGVKMLVNSDNYNSVPSAECD